MHDTPEPTEESQEKKVVHHVHETSTFRSMLFGKKRDINDPSLFHSISLIPFLAWVGLGVDGLSSCAYGPDESFRALFGLKVPGTDHLMNLPELAILLAIATTITVGVISWSYSGLIEHFPYSGGGYGVATKLLGPYFGLISGCALLVDYVLTVTTSVASSVDQIFNVVPPEFLSLKLGVELMMVGGLVVLNLRGMKESINVIVPIFLLFCATHLALMLGVFITHEGGIASHVTQIHQAVHTDTQNLGLWLVLVIFMQAYSRGAGTYTGIEAVSNGVSAMREPQVTNAKWTMLYMATSLAVTAGGLMLCYVLADLEPVAGRTMNGLLVEKVNFGTWFTWLTLGSEAGLLLFARADRVHRGAARDGEHGAGWLGAPAVQLAFGPPDEPLRRADGGRGGDRKPALYQGLGGHAGDDVRDQRVRDVLSFAIGHEPVQLGAAQEEGPGTDAAFRPRAIICALLRHPGGCRDPEVRAGGMGDDLCDRCPDHSLPGDPAALSASAGETDGIERAARRYADAGGTAPDEAPPMNPKKQTAVLLVNSYGGLGIHTLLIMLKTFPGQYSQIYFATVGVLDSGNFKGTEEVVRLKADRQKVIDHYVLLAHTLGLSAEGGFTLGTDPVAEASGLCMSIREKYPKSVFFAGKLLFEAEKWYYPLLHNETAFAISRRLQLQGIPTVVMPIRILKFEG